MEIMYKSILKTLKYKSCVDLKVKKGSVFYRAIFLICQFYLLTYYFNLLLCRKKSFT